MTTLIHNTVVPSCAKAEAAKSADRKSAPAATVWQALEWLQLDNIERSRKARSAWARGVADYIDDLLASLSQYLRDMSAVEVNTLNSNLAGVDVIKLLLNGADDWMQYSFGGCSLIYNGDIAERLAPPSQRKRLINDGSRALECQARALAQAAYAINRGWRKYTQA